jgi:hypothetical protein
LTGIDRKAAPHATGSAFISLYLLCNHWHYYMHRTIHKVHNKFSQQQLLFHIGRNRCMQQDEWINVPPF